MTTSYFDPLSTPGRKEGCTFQNITANGTTAATATVISNDTGWAVVVVHVPDANNKAIILPSGASIGDLVEIYVDNSGTAFLFPPPGEGFGFTTFTGSTPIGPNGVAQIWRKITSTQWQAVSQA